MAMNDELETAVIMHMAEYAVNNDEKLKEAVAGNTEDAFFLIARNSRLGVDSGYKIRVHVGNMIGYGYDFRASTNDGKNVRKVYEGVVKRTKEMSDKKLPMFETFLDSGIDNDIIGWYLTKPFRDQPLIFK